MTFQPSPQQALLLWRMITGETEDVREPMQSRTRPDIGIPAREQLVKNLFLSKEKRGRAWHLLLTDRAWAWAATEAPSAFSKSAEGTPALASLLRRLIPFLQEHDIPLASLFADGAPQSAGVETTIRTPTLEGPPTTREIPSILEGEIDEQAVEKACLSLAGGARKKRVRLADLRRHLSGRHPNELDRVLISMSRSGALHLYREDNAAALTEADHEAALYVNEQPRHLVILED